MKWEVLNSEKIIDNKWITVEKHKCKIDEDNIIDDFYVVKKKDFVILVVEDNDLIYLIEQYRHGIQENILNFPMGLIEDGESPEETAKRELIEETGYKTDELEHLGEFYTSPSYTSTKAHVFYSNKLTKSEKEKIDEKEGNLTLMKISKKELKEKIKNREIKDMPTLMAIHLANEKLNLF